MRKDDDDKNSYFGNDVTHQQNTVDEEEADFLQSNGWLLIIGFVGHLWFRLCFDGQYYGGCWLIRLVTVKVTSFATLLSRREG